MARAKNGARIIEYVKRPDGLYEAQEGLVHVSDRTGKLVVVVQGQVRDGASGAIDIKSSAWWVHDQLCADARWYDRTPCTPLQAALELYDILRAEGRWFRARSWFLATLLFGCRNTWRNRR